MDLITEEEIIELQVKWQIRQAS